MWWVHPPRRSTKVSLLTWLQVSRMILFKKVTSEALTQWPLSDPWFVLLEVMKPSLSPHSCRQSPKHGQMNTSSEQCCGKSKLHLRKETLTLKQIHDSQFALNPAVQVSTGFSCRAESLTTTTLGCVAAPSRCHTSNLWMCQISELQVLSNRVFRNLDYITMSNYD